MDAKVQQNYQKLRQRYEQYLELYKFFNNDSLEGATSFGDFYWRFYYYVRYEDPTVVGVKN